MFCMECGQKLPDAAKFCFACGTKVELQMAGVEAVESVKEEREAEGTVNYNSEPDVAGMMAGSEGMKKCDEQIPAKYDVSFNSIDSYDNCMSRIYQSNSGGGYLEKGSVDFSKWQNNFIEYRGRLFFFGIDSLLLEGYEKIGRWANFFDERANTPVLASIDPTTGEYRIYKKFDDDNEGHDMRYCFNVQYSRNFMFTIRQNKIYYIYEKIDSHFNANKMLKSIDIETGEEAVVYEHLKDFNDWIYSPILGEQEKLLYIAEKETNDKCSRYIVDAQTMEKVRIEKLFGYNERYVYYQRGKQIIRLEIDTFEEVKFSDIFTKKRKKEVIFIDCATDIVFYKEDEDAAIGETRLLGYNFENEVVITFESPRSEFPEFSNFDEVEFMFTGNRQILFGKAEADRLGRLGRSAGLEIYGSNGKSTGHIWDPDSDLICYKRSVTILTRNYIIIPWGKWPQEQRGIYQNIPLFQYVVLPKDDGMSGELYLKKLFCWTT